MIDLHTHSIYSDGSLSPTELVKKAKKIGISALALTDHDNADGLSEFIKACNTFHIEGIPGVEFSVEEDEETGKQLHIVGLFIEYESKVMEEFARHMKSKRLDRAVKIIKKLNSLGFNFQNTDIENIQRHNMIGRSHIAALMLKKGYISTIQEGFEKWLGAGKPAFVPKPSFNPGWIIELIHKMKGLAILAHPVLLQYNTYEKLYTTIKNLKEKGLDGVEVFYPFTPVKLAHRLLDWCQELDLLVSGGSDFHGLEIKPNVFLGTGDGNLYIPAILLHKMKEKRKKMYNIS